MNEVHFKYLEKIERLENQLNIKKLKNGRNRLGKASKKNVKLGLLAEVRRGEGSEWVLGAQPVIRSVF